MEGRSTGGAVGVAGARGGAVGGGEVRKGGEGEELDAAVGGGEVMTAGAGVVASVAGGRTWLGSRPVSVSPRSLQDSGGRGIVGTSMELAAIASGALGGAVGGAVAVTGGGRSGAVSRGAHLVRRHVG